MEVTCDISVVVFPVVVEELVVELLILKLAVEGVGTMGSPKPLLNVLPHSSKT